MERGTCTSNSAHPFTVLRARDLGHKPAPAHYFFLTGRNGLAAFAPPSPEWRLIGRASPLTGFHGLSVARTPIHDKRFLLRKSPAPTRKPPTPRRSWHAGAPPGRAPDLVCAEAIAERSATRTRLPMELELTMSRIDTNCLIVAASEFDSDAINYVDKQLAGVKCLASIRCSAEVIDSLLAKRAGWQTRREAVRNDYVHTHFAPGAGGRSRGAVRDLVGRRADGARHADGRCCSCAGSPGAALADHVDGTLPAQNQQRSPCLLWIFDKLGVATLEAWPFHPAFAVLPSTSTCQTRINNGR